MVEHLDFDNTIYGADVPRHTRVGLEDYLLRGYTPGGFLQSVLAGRLFSAAISSDIANGHALTWITKWILHEAPHGSWGSEKAIDDWITDKDGCRSEWVKVQEQKLILEILKT
jgi:hypothetical protein